MRKHKRKYTPKKATLTRVVTWLSEELGLSVYGAAIDLEHFIQYPGCQDYKSKDILKLQDQWKKNPEGPSRGEL